MTVTAFLMRGLNSHIFHLDIFIHLTWERKKKKISDILYLNEMKKNTEVLRLSITTITEPPFVILM